MKKRMICFVNLTEQQKNCPKSFYNLAWHGHCAYFLYGGIILIFSFVHSSDKMYVMTVLFVCDGV